MTAAVDHRRLIGSPETVTDDAGHNDGNVVWAAAKIRQIHERLNGLGRSQAVQNCAEFNVRDLPAQAVAAEQKDVAVARIVGPFEIEIHRFVGTKRTRDDVFRNVSRDIFLGHVAGGGHLPDQTVVERELGEALAAKSIDAAIADVGDERAFGKQHQATARGAHSLEADRCSVLWCESACWLRESPGGERPAAY